MTVQILVIGIFMMAAIAVIFFTLGYEKGYAVEDEEIERLIGEALNEVELRDVAARTNIRCIHIEQAMDIIKRCTLLPDDQIKEIQEKLEKELV